ncbi:hypothetical protein GCM10010518_00390 [Kitasatospora cinereorecta]
MVTRMSIGVLLSDPDGVVDAEVGGCPDAGADDEAEVAEGACSAGESSEHAVTASSSTPVAAAVRALRTGKVMGCRPAGRAWARSSA